jgi:quinol monooxygenase YgiN
LCPGSTISPSATEPSIEEFALIHVLALITTKPGKREEVLDAFRANVPAVHGEEGCIEYGAAIDTEGVGPFQTQLGPDTFVVVEKWADVEALKAHAAAPHMAAYAAKTKDLLASRVIHVLSPV